MVAFKSHSYRVQNQFQQSIKMTMVEMDKQSNNHVKLNNQECSSVLLSFTSRAKLMVQERVGITVPEVSA